MFVSSLRRISPFALRICQQSRFFFLDQLHGSKSSSVLISSYGILYLSTYSFVNTHIGLFPIYPARIRIESGITIETTYIFYLCKNSFHIFLRTFHNTQKRKRCFLSKAHFLLFSYSPLYPAPYNSHACSNSRSVCSVPFEVSREILFIRISRSSISSMIRILTHGYGRPSAPVT